MAEVIWTESALKDIEEIALFISNDSYQYARLQVHQFFLKAQLLETHPLAGRMVPELNQYMIRQLLCGNYRIIYELEENEKVAILTIHQQSRLLKNNKRIQKAGGKRKK